MYIYIYIYIYTPVACGEPMKYFRIGKHLVSKPHVEGSVACAHLNSATSHCQPGLPGSESIQLKE